MALSCCCSRSKKTGTEKVSSGFDEVVYPIHALDQPAADQELVTWVLSFNDVLDARQLHKSLCRLLLIDGWKKLGTRLRFKVREACWRS